MSEQGIDLKHCARLISETFNHMIYKEGFVHSDPHPGNIFVRKNKDSSGKEVLQIVLLDHGIYTNLTTPTRLSYTKLWRGILTQNESRIREASKELGADFYELFASMVVGATTGVSTPAALSASTALLFLGPLLPLLALPDLVDGSISDIP